MVFFCFAMVKLSIFAKGGKIEMPQPQDAHEANAVLTTVDDEVLCIPSTTVEVIYGTGLYCVCCTEYGSSC